MAKKMLDKITYESGAERSTMTVRWDLLCEKFIREMACVMNEGAEKYGDDNWKGGVHGHFQCPKCNQVGDGDCCQGEVCQPPIKLDKEEEK